MTVGDAAQQLTRCALELLYQGEPAVDVARALGATLADVQRVWVLAAVRGGAERAGSVARITGISLSEVVRAAQHLAELGLLLALDGEPWAITEPGAQALFGADFQRWLREVPQ